MLFWGGVDKGELTVSAESTVHAGEALVLVLVLFGFLTIVT